MRTLRLFAHTVEPRLWLVERIVAARTSGPDGAQEMDAELQRLRRELDRFVALIANGNAPQRVLEEIAARERRAKELETVLVRLKVAQSTKLDVSSIRVLALARATDLRYGIQDLVVPLELAQRWGLPHGVRGNLNERLQPWERLKDLCGQLVDLPLQHQFALCAPAVLLSCAPSATATKEERLNAHPFIRLPYFAGLAYLIAKARVEGRKD